MIALLIFCYSLLIVFPPLIFLTLVLNLWLLPYAEGNWIRAILVIPIAIISLPTIGAFWVMFLAKFFSWSKVLSIYDELKE